MTRTFAHSMLLTLLVLFPLAAHAAVIKVPDPESGIYTIQDGIDAASPGDEVVVAPGTYDAITIDKEITVRSEDGADTTTIQGYAGIDAVKFESVGSGAALLGFTLTGAAVASGIYLSNASPFIEENTIEGNTMLGRGGGIRGYDSSPTIRYNLIRNNECASTTGTYTVEGAGIYLSGEAQAPEVYDNFILDNYAHCSGGLCTDANGGGISVRGGSPRIIGNVIAGNSLLGGSVERGGAIHLRDAQGAVVANNTLYDNEASTGENPLFGRWGGAVYLASSTGTFLFANNIVMASSGIGVLCGADVTGEIHRANDLYDNPEGHFVDCPTGSGDLFVAPQMVDPAGGDYHLEETSPLVDAGASGVPGLPGLDVYQGARVSDGDGDGRAVVDIGADEYNPSGWDVGLSEAQASATSTGGRQASRAFNFLAILAVPALAVAAWRRRRQR